MLARAYRCEAHAICNGFWGINDVALQVDADEAIGMSRHRQRCRFLNFARPAESSVTLVSCPVNSQPKTRRESTPCCVTNPHEVFNLVPVRALPGADFAGFPTSVVLMRNFWFNHVWALNSTRYQWDRTLGEEISACAELQGNRIGIFLGHDCPDRRS